jgi:hypothetical protein
MEYDKQDQQEKAAFNECNPRATQLQEPATRSPGGICLLNEVYHIMNIFY